MKNPPGKNSRASKVVRPSDAPQRAKPPTANFLAGTCGAVALVYLALGTARFVVTRPDPGRVVDGLLGSASYAAAAAILCAMVFGISRRSYRLTGTLFLILFVGGIVLQGVYLADDWVWARRVALVREMDLGSKALSAEAQRVARGRGDRNAILDRMDAVGASVDQAAEIEQGTEAAKLRAVSEFVATTRTLMAGLSSALPAYGEALEPFPGRYASREQLRNAIAATDTYLASNRALYAHFKDVAAFFGERLSAAGVSSEEIDSLVGDLSEAPSHVAGIALREAEIAMSEAVRKMLDVLERHWGAWNWEPAGNGGEGGSIVFDDAVPTAEVELYRSEGRRHLEWAGIQAELRRGLLDPKPTPTPSN